MKKLTLTTLILLAFSQSVFAQSSTAGGEPYRVPWSTPQTFEDEDSTPPNNIYAPVPTDSKPATAPTTVPGGASLSHPRFKNVPVKIYKRGSRGEAVKVLQAALIDLGYGLPAGADGQFGGQTEDAVKAFQSSNGLESSGIIDRATLEVLDGVAPQLGKKVWQDPQAASALASVPVLSGKRARVLVDLSESRLIVYTKDGTPERVFPIACGAEKTPTHPGVKILEDKLSDPTDLAWKLWPESKGQAFGKRLLDLSWYDPATNSATGSDEELHGTFERDSIGSRASHGCMRLYNEDIEWLYQNLKLGDLVIIQP